LLNHSVSQFNIQLVWPGAAANIGKLRGQRHEIYGIKIQVATFWYLWPFSVDVCNAQFCKKTGVEWRQRKPSTDL